MQTPRTYRIVTIAAVLLSALLAVNPAPAAEQRNATRVGGIAGHHPYFYSGKTGQDYASRVGAGGSGFRQIEFQRIRIIPDRHGHRRVIILNTSPYYGPWYGHGNYNYNYRFNDRYDAASYVVEERPLRQSALSVAQLRPRVPSDPWSMLAGGYYDDAVGAFAMKAQAGDAGANVGYALANMFKGDHGQAAWAMRKAVDAGELAAGATRAAPLRHRLAAVANEYETNADLIRWPAERWFLAASLHYLRGDKVAAKKAIEKCVALNDQELSTAVLAKMIAGGK